MTIFKIIYQCIKLPISIFLLLTEALFWFLYILKQIFFNLFDVVKARRTIKKGILYCPRGHEVETEGGVYECEACGFVYEEGSIWFCPNPECPQPVTSHIECPTCGLSIRNPYRIGRP